MMKTTKPRPPARKAFAGDGGRATRAASPAPQPKTTTPAVVSGPRVMQLEGEGPKEQLIANLTAEGVFTNAMLMKSYSEEVSGEIGITEAVRALRVSLAEVNRGDLGSIEAMLLGQAAALNAMFSELGRRAYVNMGEHLPATDRYMRLALKAQGQCRATLETLAAIKNPPLVFARQANINNGGQQQVNNGASTPAVVAATAAHAGQFTSELNGLLEARDGERVDSGAARTAGGAHKDVATMGARNRP